MINQEKKIIPTMGTRLLLSIILFSSLITLMGCDKKEDGSGMKADFSFDFIDDNNVSFLNQSEGDYYWMIWDFGNGAGDTTNDKSKTYQIYYPNAGDYNVTLKLTSYTGEKTQSSKDLVISNDDNSITLSFSTAIGLDTPNVVTLKNTTVGDYQSFKWIYNDTEVEGEMEHDAYFPLAGNYDIELVVTKDGQDLSLIQSVDIAQDDPNYNQNLVWSDEFDYTGLPNSQYWNMETGGGGWGNNELQYYTNREANAKVANGVLTITALKEDYGGRNYTSARITTQNKFDFKYGKIEAKIKLPYGQGLWPAFWMLGDNINSVSWPACGEIDVMEMVGGTGKDNKAHSTLHWDNNGHQSYGESYTLSSGILADEFHVFSMEWDDQRIVSYIDDIQYFAIDITPSFLSEFHNNFFIIMNVAVGGIWPGSPNATTVFPQTMEVDYVRVYQYNK